MKKAALFILFFVIIFASACKKPVLNENPDYAGVWKTECLGNGCNQHILIIRNDNTGEYYTEGQDIESVSYEGKVRIKDDVLKIGLVNSFHINEPPTEKYDSVFSYCQCSYGEVYVYSWYMVIDDMTYYKQ